MMWGTLHNHKRDELCWQLHFAFGVNACAHTRVPILSVSSGTQMRTQSHIPYQTYRTHSI